MFGRSGKKGNYAYIVARVKAKKAGLMNGDAYSKMLMMSLPEISRFISESGYQKEITELTGCSEEGYFLNPLFRFQEEAPEKETPPAQDNGNSHPAKSSRRPAAILRENAGPFSGRSAVSAVSAGKSAGSRVKGSLSRTGNRLHDRRKLLSAALELTEI